MDSSYQVQSNMSVGRGIDWCISVHSMYKREVLFFTSVYLEEGDKESQSKGRFTKMVAKVLRKIDNRCARFIQFA